MRVEFGMELAEVRVPRFSVEAVEGIGKLFTLATLVLNVLESKKRVEVVFHGLNPEDPGRKIGAFRRIVDSAQDVSVRLTEGACGDVPGVFKPTPPTKFLKQSGTPKLFQIGVKNVPSSYSGQSGSFGLPVGVPTLAA